jgi:transcriptional regulator with XRE-family HTH domain
MCVADTVSFTVNQRIKLVREALELNQRDFSKLIPASHGYIAGIETGIRRVNGRLVKLIAAEFSVSEEWLTEGRGEMFVRNSDEKFSRLLSLFRELPPKYQGVVFKMKAQRSA